MRLTWKDLEAVDQQLRSEFITAIRKGCGEKAVAHPDIWNDRLFEGHNNLETRQFWRSMSQSLQLDYSQLLADKIAQAEFDRLTKSVTTKLIESAHETIKANADVCCHPGFYLDRKAFMITLFWYVEFARF